jgi:hypothetical protein
MMTDDLPESDYFLAFYDEGGIHGLDMAGYTKQQVLDYASKATAPLLARIAELEKELETERMRLAACGVVAMANTRESAEKARQMHPDYMSASCQDVMRAVDAEMGYRERIAELEADAKRYRWLRDLDEDPGVSLAAVWTDMNGSAASISQRIDAAIDNAMKEQP